VSFESVWGFDPAEALRTQQSFRWRLDCGHEVGQDGVEAVEIIAFEELPSDRDSQVKELRRMFRL